MMPGYYVQFLVSAILATTALATAVTPELLLADAIQTAEHALILHDDRTSHINDALTRFRNVLSKKKNEDDKKVKTKDQSESVKKLEDLIRRANVKQLEHLHAQLDEFMKRQVRQRQDEVKVEEKKSNDDKDLIGKERLDAMFDEVSLLGRSEALLEKWIEDVIVQEVENLVGKGKNETKKSASVVHDESCVSASTAAQEVQSALMRFQQDGIGLKDHAQRGVIVHEMTSSTFLPPPTEKEHLGYWEQFIPEDIAELFPSGWMHWEVRIPRFIQHVFGGIHGVASTTASPQTILHPDTRPGSCWPLKGSSGFVTFRLPYAVKANAVTLDHVPEQLLLSASDQLGSAPRQIKVYGYPPCSSDDVHDCEGLGFDTSDKFLLRMIQYDVEGPSTQTFYLGRAGEKEDVDAGSSGSTSCSVSASTCSSPHEDFTVAAIRLEVESNWGNEQYTCLYRFRIHGETLA